MTYASAVSEWLPERTLEILSLTTASVFVINLALLAARQFAPTALELPPNLPLLVGLLYVFGLGCWLGRRATTSNVTVVVSAGFTLAYLLSVVLGQLVDLPGQNPDPYLPILVLVLVMLLGASQFASLVGYWIGSASADAT